jgi:predicted MFS family arabinose efflux permease
MSAFDKKESADSLNVFNLVKNINSVWSETKEGLRYIKNKSNIFQPMLKLSIGWAMLGAFIVVMPGFAQHTVGINTKLAGLILIAPAGIGMVIASYLLNRYKNWSKNKVIIFSFVLCGFTLLALAMYNLYSFLSFALLIAILLMIILGMSAAFVYISSQTLLHLNSEPRMRGRVFGVAAMMINVAMGLPALFIGGIADLTSPVFTLIILALVIIIYSATLLFDED